jgi:hypothetical protein
MTELTQVIYTHALLMAPEMSDREEELLKDLCFAAEESLQSKLRPNIIIKDCHNQFVAAASMYALAALSEADEVDNLSQIQIGDVTLRRDKGSAAARCLRKQAELIMFPFVQDGFGFRRV